ncbi:potassium-transporting ATPase subunit KdpA [Caproiciproducens galactitolivorans]|uniref:Potassium-transporting ATPase potassium-binding subunit n=1 Tax=Caproiciproducens galactitolivorans TaxID=642589 RepID=A0ABT4BQ43_9FIRM|nr:potassium-transporting ATPase subunit KdpA [Caproiciproducens galactitolivorans]MCY1713011.1 potassium-transporting ATPase subunit KdpA [Caproiciproducens galactitolivorans]
MNTAMECILYLAVLILLAVPLGTYIGKVMNGEPVFLSKVILPIENATYRMLKIEKEEQMTAKKYSISVILFSVFSFLVLFLLHLLQGVLPLNPESLPGTSWHLAFNNTSSFVTNTNWQSYSGESTLSYFTQMLGLTVQNFASAAVGIAVLFALIRGFIKVKETGLGSFWVDTTRTILYILLPLSLVISIALVSQGVIQNFSSYQTVTLVQPVTLQDGTKITQEVVPQGPAASQIAIKQLGTNGGGYMGTNSAHPLENPTPFSNLIEMLSILLIPAALCFTFGRNVKDKRQGVAIFLAMFILLCSALAVIAASESGASPQLAQNGAVNVSSVGQAGGNMEGKETRFGIAASSTWAAFTTAASNGSVNSMHDSYTPLGGMIPMLLMQLGEVVFGGVGCGLYGMIGFAILAVFIAGLMVGRTPEYLGKKIEPYEMRMAVLVCLATPVAILIGSGLAAALPQTVQSLSNKGAHGFSEILYAYSSAGGNNGSAFAGFNANTVFGNVSIGLIMLFVRFVPMLATLAIAGSLVQKKRVAVSAGTLPTHNAMFVGLLIFVVLLIGALSFFPALALGPIAEYFQMLG